MTKKIQGKFKKKLNMSKVMAVGVGVILLSGLILVSPLAARLGESFPFHPFNAKKNSQTQSSEYTTNITNQYLTLPIGRKLVYEGKTADGLEQNEITITGETKKVMGITTLVYRDKVWLEGELIEDTKDYLAQDKGGNIWYFGEDVNNYENGELLDHEGSWLAGVDGAKPGIWVKANPTMGEQHLQEYYPGVAEDTVDILALNETVAISYGVFNNCLKTYDWTPLDPESKEHKYYCPEVGVKVLTEDLVTGERMELIEIKDRRGRDTHRKNSNEIEDNENEAEEGR